MQMEEYVPARVRREQQQRSVEARLKAIQSGSPSELNQRRSSPNNLSAGSPLRQSQAAQQSQGPRSKVSLVDQTVELIRQHPQKTKQDIQKKEEERVMADVLAAQRRLQSDRELAQGIAYTEVLQTSWSLPSHLKEVDAAELRKEYLIHVEGENVVPPIATFREMRIVPPLLNYLRKKRGIKKPTPIQMQGLPVIFR